MADEIAKRDPNDITTIIGVVDGEDTKSGEQEVRKIRTTDKGILKSDIGGEFVGDVTGKALKVTDLTDRELQEAQLVELRLISRKLDCLQPDDEELDVNDLDNIEE